ncbi:hypothetical protein [Streptomyces lushanensis]|uniref:hypothetical protein n=1 Tax=Streptomyces lushanensis TaxID=1434255 RepID=UPI00082BDA30|nr:hypothetical protein [Streptomyces lushanensis]
MAIVPPKDAPYTARTTGTSRQLNDAQRTTSPAGSPDGARAVSAAGSRHGSPYGARDRSVRLPAAGCRGGPAAGSTGRSAGDRAPDTVSRPPAGSAPAVAEAARSVSRAPWRGASGVA